MPAKRIALSIVLGSVLMATLIQTSPAQAAYLGESGFLGFQSNRGGTTQVYVTNPDGSGTHQLVTIPGLATYDAAWSADGSKVAFSACCPNGNYEIYSMNADGTGLTQLTDNTARDTLPAWSPSGDRIVFTSERDGNKEIYVMNADGSGQTNLSNNSKTDENPVWSPDTSKIAFDTNRTGNYEIFTMKFDGTNPLNLSNNPAYSDTEPNWNPTGLNLAFESDKTGNTDIYTMSVDGSNQIDISNNTNADDRPVWSPDGTRLAFDTKRGGNREIFVMDADGTHQINVTSNTATDQRPDWQPLPPGNGVMSVTDAGFSPTLSNIKRGQLMEWDFTGSARHSATDGSGMGLFGSGSAAPGGAYCIMLIASGTYTVVDTLSTFTAQVKVPVGVDPLTGGVTTVFTITWSSAAPLAGFVFDAQIKRPNANNFVDWKISQTALSSTFVPDAGVGTYKFRARLRNTANGDASGYSTASKITVS
jgi:Tol biopolymer transport system component